jgi:hypothetical protein
MTRDLARVERPDLPQTDPRRFDLPPAAYWLTIAKIDGQSLKASAYDPLRDQEVPVTVVSRASDHAVVELSVTDSPRLLMLEDGGPPAEEAPPSGGTPPLPPPPAGPASGPSQGGGDTLQVESVRARRGRLLVEGHAQLAGRVRIAASYRSGRKRRRAAGVAQAKGGRFAATLRPLRTSQAIQSVQLVAKSPTGQVHESRWRVRVSRKR